MSMLCGTHTCQCIFAIYAFLLSLYLLNLPVVHVATCCLIAKSAVICCACLIKLIWIEFLTCWEFHCSVSQRYSVFCLTRTWSSCEYSRKHHRRAEFSHLSQNRQVTCCCSCRLSASTSSSTGCHCSSSSASSSQSESSGRSSSATPPQPVTTHTHTRRRQVV